MKIGKATLGDKIQVIALIANIIVVVGLAIWNISQEERLSKLEYDELAPRIAMYREVTLDRELDDASYYWTVRNNGRIAAENTVVSIYSNSELPLDYCNLSVPFDKLQPRVSGNYILFEGLMLSPQGSFSVYCHIKSGLLLPFIEKYKFFPNVIPSLNCAQSKSYDFEILYLLPNLGITANNLEPSRVSCVEELRDVNK